MVGAGVTTSRVAAGTTTGNGGRAGRADGETGSTRWSGEKPGDGVGVGAGVGVRVGKEAGGGI